MASVKISFYLDEDAQRTALIDGLRKRGGDVLAAWDAGMREREDEDHLLFATAQGRVLYGFNVGDYQGLHTQFITQGRTHAGIVIARQQTYSVGEELRRLSNLMARRSAEEMKDQLVFLGAWG